MLETAEMLIFFYISAVSRVSFCENVLETAEMLICFLNCFLFFSPSGSKNI